MVNPILIADHVAEAGGLHVPPRRVEVLTRTVKGASRNIHKA